MHFAAITVVTVHTFNIDAVALLDQSRTRNPIGNHHRAVVNHMTYCTQYAKCKRVIGEDIDGAVVFDYRIRRGVGIELHTDHTRASSACGTEVDGAIVNQLRVLITFHSHSTGAADVHDAVILGNKVAVGDFHGTGAVVIEVDDPVILVPEEGILIAGIISADYQ